MEEAPLASLSLTHVHYVCLLFSPIHSRGQLTDIFSKNPNDPLSYCSAWLALVPQALCVTYVTLIWASREIEIMMMFAGQMACEAFNFLLKRWIKEERPKRTNAESQSPHGYFGLRKSRNVWQRLWHALVTRAIRNLLLNLHQPVPACATRARSIHDAFAGFIYGAFVTIICGLVMCCCCCYQSGIPQLPYVETSDGRMCCWCDIRLGLVPSNHIPSALWLDRMGFGYTAS